MTNSARTALMVLMILILTSLLWAQTEVSKGKTEWDRGILMFKSDDGNFSTRFDMRMYLNGGFFMGDDEHLLSNGTHVRKARLALKTQLFKIWRAEWDIDVAEGTVEIKDMFLSFRGFNKSHLKFGHFKMPLGLEELTSSRYQTFVERAYPMLAFETDRRLGLEYSRWGNQWNLRAAVFAQTMDMMKNKTKDETGNGAGARLVLAPIKNDALVLHTGVAVVFQQPDESSDAMKFQSEPETKLGDTEILAATVFDVKNSLKTGLEAALGYKGFTLQGEYIQTNLKRMHGAKDAKLDGGYAFLAWTITGESRPWDADEGEFGQIIPRNNTLGAWQLAVRYSHLNLTDQNAGVLGGKANNYTFGINWYANPNIRFLLNYTLVDNSKYATNDGFPGDYDFSVAHFMAMVYF
ncbi:OprO/OprP family phosphate-selective porin [candidate division KSB1 bacterium]|nr:OprO/OprP family phosphate-selective porin [candidate division KSB1 bacterium]